MAVRDGGIVFDALDRRLLEALQLDVRAPFSVLAHVLGVSDQTVARRYARLRTSARLRPLAFTDPAVVGETQWVLRTRSTPDAALAVAKALARRDDTSWITLISGGTEIACALRLPDAPAADALLLGTLGRTARIVDVSAQCVLHVFYGGSSGLVSKGGLLTDDEAQQLRDGLPPAAERRALDDVDERLVAAIAQDARMPVEQLAALADVPASTARRRLDALRGSGLLYLDLEFDPRVIERTTRTHLWLTVEPGRMHEVGTAMADHPEVSYLSATTGRTNLHASVATRGVAELYEYLAHRVGAVPGVQAVEASPVVRTVKEAGRLAVATRAAQP